MNFDDYQKAAAKTAIYQDAVYPILGLASEAGEVAGKVKKYIRDGGDYRVMHEELAKELGDVLWYVSAIAKDIGYDLSVIASMNLDKLSDRQSRGKIQGSGDNR